MAPVQRDTREGGGTPWWRWLTGAEALVAVGCGVGGWLVASGLGSSRAATLGLPPTLCVTLGAALLLAVVGWVALGTLRHRDGPPMPGWAAVTLVVGPALVLVAGYAVVRAVG